MRSLKQLYRSSDWYTVYNLSNEHSRARFSLLCTTIVQAMVGGFSGGIFYTGLLVGYGINIVNISIISVVPYIASLFSLFTPYIFSRIPRRRTILTITRILYYTINILGVTLLPQLVHDPAGRVVGLIVIIFLSNIISALFSPGYSPWHMYHITPDVRTSYHACNAFVSSISSTVVTVLASLFTDSLEGQAQLNLITTLRYIAYGIAFLDVYFLQKPKEPEYATSTDRPKLLDIIRIPMSNSKFRLTMLICVLLYITTNLSTSIEHVWLLETVKADYFYINVLNAIHPLFLITTSKLWGRYMNKYGTFHSIAVSCIFFMPTFLIWAFVDHSNYLWLYTIGKVAMFTVYVLMQLSSANLIYVNLPKEDQICYICFYNILVNLSMFVSIMSGTYLLTSAGDSAWNLLGHSITGVPIVLLIKGLLMILFGLFVLLIRKKVEPDQIR